MHIFKSRANISFFALNGLILFGVFTGFATSLFIKGFGQLDEGKHWFRTSIWPAVLVLMIGLMIIYQFLKNWQNFRISEKGITISRFFKSEFISWEEVKKIELTGKAEDRILGFTQEFEVLSFELKNGDEKAIFEHYYRNFDEARRLLSRIQVQIQSHQSVKITSVGLSETKGRNKLQHFDFLNIYKDRFISSVHGVITCIGLALMILKIIFYNIDYFPLIVFPSLFLAVMGFLSHYFLLDKNYLVIKNHIWFFYSKHYKVSDINEIVVDHEGRRGWCLRVITKDYKSRSFPAGSLKTKTWVDMIHDLEKLTIPVRMQIDSLKEALVKARDKKVFPN
ncbi:hypothetical protein [Echinicola shivajiensis]|uniref:hypothetical protein n=1 Tax=Echinicola shivajiensis TaxID=1035916 RepID=UPI001BFCD27C|nr:hypothetical protein [Echinicola shivajiensis]